jgi:hypothetical protein
MVWRAWATPGVLVGVTFLAATAAAPIMLAWQSIVAQLVPRQHLQPAVASMLKVVAHGAPEACGDKLPDPSLRLRNTC